MDHMQLLSIIADRYKHLLSDNLIGIYAHGSVALGCFNPLISDIDFIVTVSEEPISETKKALITVLLNLLPSAPAKGFEMSVVLHEHCRKFIYPTPYVLHFSKMHESSCRENLDSYCRSMKGEDADLAAHFTIIRNAGLKIWGQDISQVFGDVPLEYYADSIIRDAEDAENHLAEDPVSTVLNLCRVLAFMQDKLILSKIQGGQWAQRLLHRPYTDIITEATECYNSGSSSDTETGRLKEFHRYMINLINENKKSAFPT